ncbi:MAG: Lrp/AsnC family transcriptional regulator [Acidimicrobiales bacterium]
MASDRPGSFGERQPERDEALDVVDQTIIERLVADGRQSVNELARSANVSRATAYQRLARLRERGVIVGFSARVDPVKLGKTLSALVLIRVEQPRWREVVPELLSLPGVEWLGVTAGEFDFALVVRARDVENLRDVVLEQLQAMRAVRSSETVLLLEDHRVVL